MKKPIALTLLALALVLLAACSGGAVETAPSSQVVLASPTPPPSGGAGPEPTEPAAPAPAGTPTAPPPTEAPASPTEAEPGPSPTVENPASPTAEPPARPGPFPDPSGYTWALVADGFRSPVGLYHAGDGTGRLFVLEQRGRILILSGGEVLPEPFLDITDRVGSDGNEQGLLGLAFPPNFAESGLFYVNYTDRNGNTQIARFSVSPGDPNRADPASEAQVLFVQQPYSNHNGGDMAFGPDGYLYLGLGDGGAAGDPQNNGQNPSTLLGKLLRIDVLQADPGVAYSIPPDNPFANGGGAPEVWAFGLRNPWRFSFDRATGDLYIGDVGQGDWEEIDYVPAGSGGGWNFGWSIMEGMQCYGRPDCSTQGLMLPAAVTGTHDAGGCAVTGGYVYRGPSMPEWQGLYLFGDFCNGRVWGLRPLSVGWDMSLLFLTPYRITSFGVDEAGELYLLDRQGGIYRLQPGS